jgi:hypothetical protein
MNCPGCGESNEAGMAFCINCGHSLAAASASATPAATLPKPEPQQPQPSGPRPTAQIVLVCSVCNKTDPLNGQFCVYCGGRTAPGPAPAANATFAGSASMSGGYTGQADSYRPSQEVVRVQPLAPPAGGGGGGLLAVVMAVVLGVAISLAATYLTRTEINKMSLRSFCPHEGVLLYSNCPNASISLQDSRKKSLIFARTSADGSAHLSNVFPGAYMLNLTDASGKSQSKELSVRDDEASIIGYPIRLELK